MGVKGLSMALVVALASVAVLAAYADEPVPGMPENVKANDVSPTEVELSWDAPEKGYGTITGYKIESYIPGMDTVVVIANTGSNATSYTDINLDTGTRYIYNIYAINGSGTGPRSVDVIGRPTESSTRPDQIPPGPVTELAAKDVSPTEIMLEWQSPDDNNSPLITGYRIDNKTGDKEYDILVNNTANTKTSYTAANLTTGVEYTFRVYAWNSIGLNSTFLNATSSETAEASATPTESSVREVKEIKPERPTNVKTTPISPTGLSITWNESRSNEGPPVSSYQIDFKVGNGDFEMLAEDIFDRSFVHEGLDMGKEYVYRVYARNNIGLSGASPSSAPASPEHTITPTQLVATGTSPTEVRLSWSPPSETYKQSIGGYNIERETSAQGIYVAVGTTDGAESYLVSDLETGKEYTFVVQARFGRGSTTQNSNEATITLTEDSGKVENRPPTKPINFQATAASSTTIDLTWDVPANDGGSPVTGYKIDAKSGDGRYAAVIDDTKSTDRKYKHESRTPASNYTYRIFAINEVGTGSPSTPADVSTPAKDAPTNDTSSDDTQTDNTQTGETPSGTAPTSPKSLKTTTVSESQIDLAWSEPGSVGSSPITGYKVEVRDDSGDFVVLSSDIKTKSYSHTGLEKDTSYTYRVFAINAAGTSSPTNTKTASTVMEEQKPVDEKPEDKPEKEDEKPEPVDDTQVAKKPEPVDEKPKEDPKLRVPGFPDPAVTPQQYMDRYDTDPAFKDWFDQVFPEYTIQEVVGAPETKKDEETKEPPKDNIRITYYADRYKSDPAYKKWFDTYFGEMSLAELIPEEPAYGICGAGTELRDGICQIIVK